MQQKHIALSQCNRFVLKDLARFSRANVSQFVISVVVGLGGTHIVGSKAVFMQKKGHFQISHNHGKLKRKGGRKVCHRLSPFLFSSIFFIIQAFF
jgi:hypothetical protein